MIGPGQKDKTTGTRTGQIKGRNIGHLEKGRKNITENLDTLWAPLAGSFG